METEKAIEILKNYLSETYSKFCKVGTVGIPNEEYFAIETILQQYRKQEKMIELMAEHIKTGCDFDNRIQNTSQIKQHFEKKAEEE